MSRRGHVPRDLPERRGPVDEGEGVNFVSSKVMT
jgi:hypothetical protein